MCRVIVALIAILATSTSVEYANAAQAIKTVAQTRSANTGASVIRITASYENAPIATVLKDIAQRAKVRVSYSDNDLEGISRVSVELKNVSVAEAFARVLKSTKLVATALSTEEWTIAVNKHVIRKVVAQGVITGKVIDSKTGKGILGATVSVGNDTHGVTTGADGSYRLTGVAAGTRTVTVRLVGYAKQTRSITVGEGATLTVDFTLEPSASVLDQVIVTGTVVATELKAVPSAITVVTAKQIEDRGITRIDQLFRGDIPGLFALNLGSESALDEVKMFSRGATALSYQSTGSTSPSDPLSNTIKTYVDGVELANPRYLSQIDPKSIERIEILTGPQASTIYGSNAINGVMQIFTKRGASSRPQLMLNLMSGWVENNFSTARTPQHDYSLQLNGVEGKLSYSGGTSWLYMGPWTPGKQTVRLGTFGGARLDINTGVGAVSTDVTVRRTSTVNREGGDRSQSNTGRRETGLWSTVRDAGLTRPAVNSLDGQTLGFAMTYTPSSSWSHEIGFGVDASNIERRSTALGYRNPRDTTLFLEQSNEDRRSVRYTTTLRVPMSSLVQMTTTLGVDAWQSKTSSMSILPSTLTGILVDAFGTTQSIRRQPYHNTGSFLQTQVAIKDQLFLTYGLRAEWNPAYGSEAQPNYAPRFGAAYTRDIGAVTAKLRASYGRSTRPPQPLQKAAYPASASLSPYFAPFDLFLANPDLSPEHQQGVEGGLELYFGTRGSLVLTRYNQTVDRLIVNAAVDSVRSLVPCEEFSCEAERYDTEGYGYWGQYQYLNIGNIRNQGWELQGSANLGPLTARGTYSWTKSRTIGLDSRYRSIFTPSSYPQYQPGASFDYLPEHTWSSGLTYARSAVTIGINVTGLGRTTNQGDAFYYRHLAPQIRLIQNRQNITFARYVAFNRGYAMADLSGSYRLSSRIEGILQIQNLADRYVNDSYADYATMGRQSKIGVRMRVM